MKKIIIISVFMCIILCGCSDNTGLSVSSKRTNETENGMVYYVTLKTTNTIKTESFVEYKVQKEQYEYYNIDDSIFEKGLKK